MDNNSNSIHDEAGRGAGDMDNISIEETVTSFSQSIQDSTATQLLYYSEASATEFDGSTTLEQEEDDLIEDFLNYQFPASTSGTDNQRDGAHSSANTNPNVQDWLSKSEKDDDAAAPDTEGQVTDDEEDETPMDVEKIAAVLVESIENDEFHPDAWMETNDDDQEVPRGDWKAKMIQEIKQRHPLALMNMINECCSTSDSWQRYLYIEILSVAAVNLRDKYEIEQPPRASSSTNPGLGKQRLQTFDNLRICNNGEYYSLFKFRFKKVPKCKQLIVSHVQKFINTSISDAFESRHAVLFSGYAIIPKAVTDYNTKHKLQLSAEQMAKMGKRLQKAVYEEMVDRCLNFLAHMGYEFRKEKLQADQVDKENQLPFNKRGPASLSSSQGSLAESMRSISSQESSMSVPGSSQSSINGTPPLNPEIVDAMQNSPDFIEFLRNGGNQEDSPAGSMGSYNSYNGYSLSPLTHSLPERDRSPIVMRPEDDNGLNGSFENTVMLDMEDNIISPASLTGNNSIVSEAGSHDEGPQRRRRRLN